MRTGIVGFVVGAAQALALGAAACGGGDDGTRSEPTPAAKASVRREVTARVDGRSLRGHCRGTQRRGTPAILLESGMGGGQGELAGIEQAYAGRTLVCAYDRAGTGSSDPAPAVPHPVSALVADLDAFAAAAKARPPYVLVGQSMGGNVVLSYAQAHPRKVAGFVAMNPVPPAETWLKAAKRVMTDQELLDERLFYRGENAEQTSFREPTLARPLPADMPYAVMFDEDCEGDTDFCGRILPALKATTKSLAAVGEGGRFVPAEGAGHDIPAHAPELVHQTIDGILKPAP